MIFSGGDWSLWLPVPTQFINTPLIDASAVCAPSDLAALGQTSAVADRLFQLQEMGGLRTGEIRHLGDAQSNRH